MFLPFFLDLILEIKPEPDWSPNIPEEASLISNIKEENSWSTNIAGESNLITNIKKEPSWSTDIGGESFLITNIKEENSWSTGIREESNLITNIKKEKDAEAVPLSMPQFSAEDRHDHEQEHSSSDNVSNDEFRIADDETVGVSIQEYLTDQ